MFKKILINISLLFFCFSAHAGINVVVLDIEKVLTSSLAAKHASELIKGRLDDYQVEINKKSDDLKVAQDEIVSQTNILTQEALQKKQGSFLQRLKTLEKEVQDKKKELDGLYVKAISEIEKTIDVIVKELSEKNDYNLVVAKNEVIYFRNITDISQEVITILNSRLKKVNIDI